MASLSAAKFAIDSIDTSAEVSSLSIQCFVSLRETVICIFEGIKEVIHSNINPHQIQENSYFLNLLLTPSLASSI